MVDYIKDWRIWVLAIIILIIIRFPVFGEEIKVKPVKKRSDNIEFKFNDVKFKWKMNRFETKWKANDRFNFRHNLIADDINEYRTMVLFTLEF
jgi:hypothetical protein